MPCIEMEGRLSAFLSGKRGNQIYSEMRDQLRKQERMPRKQPRLSMRLGGQMIDLTLPNSIAALLNGPEELLRLELSRSYVTSILSMALERRGIRTEAMTGADSTFLSASSATITGKFVVMKDRGIEYKLVSRDERYPACVLFQDLMRELVMSGLDVKDPRLSGRRLRPHQHEHSFKERTRDGE